jgi:hypothetical protein
MLIETKCAWFSTFLENPLVNLVKRRMCIKLGAYLLVAVGGAEESDAHAAAALAFWP